MKQLLYLLKQYWLTIVFYLLLLVWFIDIFSEAGGIHALAATVILIIVGAFLSKKVLKLHKRGPLPWYASSFIWMGVLTLLVAVIWFSRFS